jgi:hypothetical protein
VKPFGREYRRIAWAILGLLVLLLIYLSWSG